MKTHTPTHTQVSWLVLQTYYFCAFQIKVADTHHAGNVERMCACVWLCEHVSV